MIQIRDASTRGSSRLNWLDSRHSFSFADYQDPAHMGVFNLRVINDQDGLFYGALLGQGETAALPIPPARTVYVQVARGRLTVNGKTLGAGDGGTLSGEHEVRLAGIEPADVLVFDLP